VGDIYSTPVAFSAHKMFKLTNDTNREIHGSALHWNDCITAYQNARLSLHDKTYPNLLHQGPKRDTAKLSSHSISGTAKCESDM
jgi:hypothetical protein